MSVDMFQYSPKLRCYTDGRVERLFRKGWKLAKNTANHPGGYNTIKINHVMYLRHRFIAVCFLGLSSLEFDGEIMVDHIDRNRLNNSVDNLRLANAQQNGWNNNAKGYYFHKEHQKYKAQIKVDGKQKHLGYFSTAEEAHEAYLKAKAIYHVF